MNILRQPDRVRERLRQSAAARNRALQDGLTAAPCAEARMGCSFTPGARVFDRVTGAEGVVLGGTIENVISPATDKPAG